MEAMHSCALDGAYAHEDIIAAVIRLNESIAFLAVESLHRFLRHVALLSQVRI